MKAGCADNERPDGSAIGYAMKGTFEIAGGADAGYEIPGTPVCEGGDAGGVGGGMISVRRHPISSYA